MAQGPFPVQGWNTMGKLVVGIAVLIGVGLLLSFAGTANSERGQLLYENHCMGCHESVVHVRERRHTKTLPELRAEINRWAKELKLGWGSEEVGDVLDYLNARYYLLTE
jgi:hypothetical protein